MMKLQKKLSEVFEDAFTDGIFNSLQGFNVPWKNDDIVPELDLTFIGNYGDRIISPLVEKCLDSTGKLTPKKQCLLASAIYNLNKVNWVKEYDTLLFEYNPIENYSMVETHTGSDTVTDTPTNWKETETQTPTNWKETETQTPTNWKETETKTPTNWKETETQTPTDWTESKTETVGQDGYKETDKQTPTNWKETTTGLQADNQADADNSIYAFNSSSAVKVSESTSKVSSKSEVSHTGTYETEHSITGEKITDITRTGTYETEKETSGTFETETERTGTYETEKETSGTFETETERTGTYEKETAYDTELRRSGNIGVTTSQQMITSERELWLWHYFQDIVFKDIVKMLTLPLY